MNKTYLLTGGNEGDRSEALENAILQLESYAGKITARSAVYETAAWGRTDQPPFLNQALELNTTLEPLALLGVLLKIEEKMGRVRKEKYGPRIIDIDILLFNQQVLDLPSLKIPHPELPNRRFALLPLAEIAGEMAHPVLKKTIRELLKECQDSLEVRLFPVRS
jgi:2-amino-4-hydroxy-6-hydroxymethyldihydropteridine diphosphokinase